MTLQPASAPPTSPPDETQGASPLTEVRKGGERTNGVPPTRSRPAPRWYQRNRILLLTSLVLLVGGVGAAWLLIPGLHSSRPYLVLHTVKRENIVQTIVEKGELQSADNHDIINKVNHEALATNNKTNIKKVIDDGSIVKKGDTLIVLDSSKLEDLLRTQGITRDKAENDMIFARATLEVTLKSNATDLAAAERKVELARKTLEEYRDGTYPSNLKDLNSKILKAEADLEENKDYTAYVDRMVNKKFMSSSQAQAAHSKLLGSELDLKKNEEDKRVLVNFTYPKLMKQYQGDLDDAQGKLDALRISTSAQERKDRNDFKTKEAIFKQEQTKFDDIKAEIDKCVIKAEKDGLVVYFVSQQARRGIGQLQNIVAEGEQVFLGQKLMQMPDLNNMIVKTNIHETLVSKVKPGQEVRVRPHSFAGKELKGKVKSKATVAAQQDFFSGDVKVYETIVQLEGSLPDLKPGMSAEVMIYTDIRAKDVLTVPVQAIVRVPGKQMKFKVFVKTNAGIEEKEVEVGINDEKKVEIKSGLSEGDEVVLNVDVLQGENKGKDKGATTAPAGPGGPGGYQGGQPGGVQGGQPAGVQGGTPGGVQGGQPGGVGGKPGGPGTPGGVQGGQPGGVGGKPGGPGAPGGPGGGTGVRPGGGLPAAPPGGAGGGRGASGG